jgi:hypothetical protein
MAIIISIMSVFFVLAMFFCFLLFKKNALLEQQNEIMTIAYDNMKLSLDRVSDNIFEFQQYINTLKDPEQDIVTDYDNITDIFAAADAMLSNFDVLYSQNQLEEYVLNTPYPMRELKFDIKRGKKEQRKIRQEEEW